MSRTKDPLGGNFWRLLIASAVSNLGDGIVRTVIPLLAITLTRDPVLIGALTVAGVTSVPATFVISGVLQLLLAGLCLRLFLRHRAQIESAHEVDPAPTAAP